MLKGKDHLMGVEIGSMTFTSPRFLLHPQSCEKDNWFQQTMRRAEPECLVPTMIYLQLLKLFISFSFRLTFRENFQKEIKPRQNFSPPTTQIKFLGYPTRIFSIVQLYENHIFRAGSLIFLSM